MNNTDKQTCALQTLPNALEIKTKEVRDQRIIVESDEHFDDDPVCFLQTALQLSLI